MRPSTVIALLAAAGFAAGAPLSAADSTAANLPGLDKTQSAHARAIIADVQKQKLGQQGCRVAMTEGLTKTNMLVYANSNVPASLKLPHDAVSSDHDAVGIFQLLAEFYPDIAADMDPARSAALLFERMTAISGWKTMNVASLCQKMEAQEVYPFAQHVSAAEKICSAAGL